MGRIRRGWDLTKKAWGVVRSNPSLLKLPVYGGLLALLALAVFAVPAALLIAPEDATQSEQIIGGVVLLAGMYLASFSVIFFNVALAAAADQAFQGAEADTAYGISVARERVGVIAAWALVAGLVSLFFAVLRDRGGLAGQIAAGIGAAIWSLVTFMVIPVLAFEGIGPFAAIKRSTLLFRQRWGQQITGNIAIGVIAAFAFIIGALICAGGIYAITTESTAAIVLGGGLALGGLVVAIASVVVSGAVRGVFGVALYHYVAENQLIGPFSGEDLESAVQVKGARA